MRLHINMILCAITLTMMLSSCSHYQTKNIADDLDPNDLYAIYNAVPVDLKAKSQCPTTPSVKILNDETRNTEVLIFEYRGHKHFINPKVLTDNIITYMGDAYEKSGIRVSDASTKVLHVSIDDAAFSYGPFSARDAIIKLKITIPEIQYHKVFTKESWSIWAVWTTMAYAIHRVTWDIIDDPTIQKYILCH